MWPVLNGVTTKVFKELGTVDHDFRNRSQNIDSDFELLGEIEAQPVFFSLDRISKRREIGLLDASGYLIMRTKDLGSIGIVFSPTKSNFIGYRFLPYINGEFSNRFLELVEPRPKSPFRGSYLFWELYFNEVILEPTIKDTYSLTPKVEIFETAQLVNA